MYISSANAVNPFCPVLATLFSNEWAERQFCPTRLKKVGPRGSSAQTFNPQTIESHARAGNKANLPVVPEPGPHAGGDLEWAERQFCPTRLKKVGRRGPSA